MGQWDEHPDDVMEGQWVPIFPLPNAVLMPRHILPLHVFETRYRAMTEDALAGDRLIAIALLKPDYETLYHTLEAPIHDVICIGRIIRGERLADGRFNILLQGRGRAVILEEDRGGEYRMARVSRLTVSPVAAEVECAYRAGLRRLLTTSYLGELAKQANWLNLFDCPDLSFSECLDVLAAATLSCPEEKQKFLEEVSVSQRARLLCATFEAYEARARKSFSKAKDRRSWPPQVCSN